MVSWWGFPPPASSRPDSRIRFELFCHPVLWCAITGATLWTMGSPEVLLMPSAGLSTLIFATYRRLRQGRLQPAPKSTRL